MTVGVLIQVVGRLGLFQPEIPVCHQLFFREIAQIKILLAQELIALDLHHPTLRGKRQKLQRARHQNFMRGGEFHLANFFFQRGPRFGPPPGGFAIARQSHFVRPHQAASFRIERRFELFPTGRNVLRKWTLRRKVQGWKRLPDTGVGPVSF